MIDGLSGAEIMGVLFDLAPEGSELPEPTGNGADRQPSELEMLARGLLGFPRYPLRILRSLPEALPNLDESPVFGEHPGHGAGREGRRSAHPAAQQPRERGPRRTRPTRPRRRRFNGRISRTAASSSGELSLDEVKEVKNKRDCTVNDVVVSVCAGAVGSWLLDHDELPADPLVAQVPVSVRTDEQMGTFGNRIMLMSAPLFTNEPDPVRRLEKTHEALAAMKEHHRALPAELLQDTNHFIPPAVFARAARATFAISTSGRGRPTWNLVVSNVPGPAVPALLRGRASWSRTTRSR